LGLSSSRLFAVRLLCRTNRLMIFQRAMLAKPARPGNGRTAAIQSEDRARIAVDTPCSRMLIAGSRVGSMPRHLRFLPIVWIALAVQILAPIAATWAVAMAAADPLQSAEICHTVSDASSSQSDQGGGRPAHHGACAICCVVQASASIDAPQQTAFTVPHFQATHVDWIIAALDLSPFRAGSNAQARAPPLSM
jgi:Protein of unknown function (DUF2946)